MSTNNSCLMSGHSKWHSIKHQKCVADQKRGKIFSKHSKLISVAVRNGGADPEMNPRLRMAVDNARDDNMPNDNIERAIKKGAGELKGDEMHEITYEGFGPAGTALLVSVVTDNKNRSASSLRIIMTKNGGNMGSAGATAWMFEQKGIIEIDMKTEDGPACDKEAVELAAIDAGAQDIEEDGETLEVITAAGDLASVRKALEAADIRAKAARLAFIPKETVKITDANDARKIIKLMEAIEEDEDVTEVSSNFDISADVMATLAALE